MQLIKRLHFFVLKSFLPLFAMTFFIVLFIVLMQFLWRYIDDLVGKGLSLGVIAELFFYAAVSMVPMALPLAILLASLMTFGNFGEKFELTAMKAAGISLLRVMAPLVILISGVAVGAFFFQNDILPKAQVKMWTLLFSMRQKSPEVEIPEGVFYDQIPGINLFVGEKDKSSGMLRDVKIYDVRKGSDVVTILVSDSARMALTPDMRYIYLNMFQGYQYEKMNASQGLRNDPFRRERFYTKELLIPFDANFNRLDEGGVADQYVGKNIAQLSASVDSITLRIDSLGGIFAGDLRRQAFPALKLSGYNKPQPALRKVESAPVDIDSLMRSLDPSRRAAVFAEAATLSKGKQNMSMFSADVMAQEKKIMRRHGIELMKKFTLSVACLVFFFIGAPLGAIIRKGGLGMPLVISILLFLFYYIIDNSGYKMARDGHIPVWAGMWLSTFVLAPLGIFVTYKAMNDSAVFDPDRIKMFFSRILRRREPRTVAFKEVIINDISLSEAMERMTCLQREALDLYGRHTRPLGYLAYLRGGYDFSAVAALSEAMEDDITYLQDSRNAELVGRLSDFPMLTPPGVLRPTRRKWLEYSLMVCFPIGLTLWLLSIKAHRDVRRDLSRTAEVAARILAILQSDEADTPQSV